MLDVSTAKIIYSSLTKVALLLGLPADDEPTTVGPGEGHAITRAIVVVVD